MIVFVRRAMPFRRICRLLFAASLAALMLALGVTGCGSSSTTPSGPSSAPTVCPNTPSGTFTLNAGETLQMKFAAASSNADVLVTAFGFLQATGSFSYRLLNGAAVLGTAPQGPTPFWRSSGSQFTGGTVIDFTAIASGTIDGRAEFAMSNGLAQFDLSQARVVLARSTASNAFTTMPGASVTGLALISSACH